MLERRAVARFGTAGKNAHGRGGDDTRKAAGLGV
jgi:hypothetical protein